MIDDAELLRRFARQAAHDALAEVVRRHIDFVYQTALREVGGNAHSAADVTQEVFLHLARKAAALAEHRVLKGWLFTTARYLAANLVRAEQRRRQREEKAHDMHTLANDPAGSANWEEVRPLINGALSGLSARDREAVLLRYFEGRDYAEIGSRLSLTADAARLRVERALEKMRSTLAHAGVSSGAAALAAALTTQAGLAAPAGLAASVTGVALAGATSAGAAAGAGLFTFMSMTKLQMGLTGAILASGAVAWVVQGETNDALRTEVAQLRAHEAPFASLEADNRRLRQNMAEVEALEADRATLAGLRLERSQALPSAGAARAGAQEKAGEVSVYAYNGAYNGSTEPTPVARVQNLPSYPERLRAMGVSVQVTVRIAVDANGRVTEVTKAGGMVSGNRGGPPNGPAVAEEFFASAREAILQWQFEPVTKDGQPVSSRTMATLSYSPDGTVKLVPPQNTPYKNPFWF